MKRKTVDSTDGLLRAVQKLVKFKKKKNHSQSSVQLKYSPDEQVEDSVDGTVNTHFNAFPWTFWNELFVSSLDSELSKDSLDCEGCKKDKANLLFVDCSLLDG